MGRYTARVSRLRQVLIGSGDTIAERGNGECGCGQSGRGGDSGDTIAERENGECRYGRWKGDSGD